MLATADGSLYNLSQRIVNAPGTDQVGTRPRHRRLHR